jgi:hypothetical protein
MDPSHNCWASSLFLPCLKTKDDLASRKTILLTFLIIPCEAEYSCIMGRTTLKSLEEVPLTIHLKMCTTDKKEVITMEVDKK